MRHALGQRSGACSLRVSVFSRGFQRDHPSRPAKPDVLVTVGGISYLGYDYADLTYDGEKTVRWDAELAAYLGANLRLAEHS